MWRPTGASPERHTNDSRTLRSGLSTFRSTISLVTVLPLVPSQPIDTNAALPILFWMTLPIVAFAVAGGLAVGTVVFGIVNAVVKPIVQLLSLPLTILTLGLFSLVINAAMFGLTSLFSPLSIDGFWAAFWGAIIVALVSWFASSLVRDRT